MRNTLVWILAIILTLAAAVYQKVTGPTYPMKGKTKIGQSDIAYNLPRSHSTLSPCEVNIALPKEVSNKVKGILSFRLWPNGGDWRKIDMSLQRDEKTGDRFLSAKIPNQPPAGKVQYKLLLKSNGKEVIIGRDKPIVIRFKGDVPAYFLIPHIVLMALAMLFSFALILKFIFRQGISKATNWAAFTFLAIGGMMLGPIVQKYAFGELWTGVPFGWDLTDNKTLVVFLFWLFAIAVNLKKKAPFLYIMAAVLLLAIYLIPHSVMGSSLDYKTMKIKTGG